VKIRSIGKIDAERNPKTIAALTTTVSTMLRVSPDRIFINLDDIQPGNWGARGGPVA
jgi:phenylpyruvate tautomerase PptA (4-oxalocrotonate tautomerase family)